MSSMTTVDCKTVPDMHLSNHDTPEHEQNAPQVRIPVLLPDMFVSFLAQNPRVNPHYEKVKRESEAWINKYARRCARFKRRF